MITIEDYWMGRDKNYASELTPAITANALVIVGKVNELLAVAQSFGWKPQLNAAGTLVNSGWRPRGVNKITPGAAPNSKHMTGQACDVYDPDGTLKDWLMTAVGQEAIRAIGLWMEHPASTKGWCHLQDIPPASGHRVFYP